MAYSSLSQYIQILRDCGELIEITEFVNPHLEITEIADRFSKQEGTKNKAILCTNTGTGFPLFINGFGSETRINKALGTKHLDEPKERIQSLFSKATAPKQSILEALKMLPLLSELQSWMPKYKKGKGACQEVIESNVDLSKLPILTCWPHDGGKFITLPMVITKLPETGIRNVGMYRMQVIDNTTTAMHWHLHKTGANHYNAYKQLGTRMPVAVALGGDPAHTFAATAPLPENIDEYMLSGFLRKKHVELVKCITCDLHVPADADIVLEGYVDITEDLFLEGPFGDHTGFYSLPDMYPKFHITCITHKKYAIYPTTIVGIPPMEDAWIGKATERIFLAPIKLLLVPELLDYWMPFEGVAHNLVIARIQKKYAGQAQKVMSTLWGAGQMMFNKTLIVIDEHTEMNPEAICNALLHHCNINRDIHIHSGPLDVLDHAAPHTGFGSKIGFDATQKLDSECDTDATLYDSLYTIIPCNIHDTKEQACAQSTNISKFYILCDATLDKTDTTTIVWHVLNNIHPQIDCTLEKINTTNVFVIDGRTKPQTKTTRDWPTPVIMDSKTIAKVDERWQSLQIGEFIPSPSKKYTALAQTNSAWYYSHSQSNT